MPQSNTTTPTPFLSSWANKFIASAKNPSAADLIGAAMGGVSGVASPLAKVGLAGEVAENAARQADLLIGGKGAVPGIAIGGAQDGPSGFFREVAGAAAGTLAGWGVGPLGAIAAAAVLPEALVGAAGIVLAVGAAYATGKLVTSGIDAFNQWQQDAVSSGPLTVNVHGLPDGSTVTTYGNGTYSIAKNGAVYSYDSQNNVTGVQLQGGQNISVNNQTGVLTASDSSGKTISTQVTPNANGGLQLTDPSTGKGIGTVDQTADGGVLMTDPSGAQVTIPQAQSGQTPTVFQLNGDGTTSTTTISADGTTAKTLIIGPDGSAVVTATTVGDPSTNTYKTSTTSSNGKVNQNDMGC